MTYAGHGTRTQRDSLHVIATSNPNDLDAVVKRWIAIADKAGADADQVKAKLSALVTTGGWTAMNLGSLLPIALLAGALLWLTRLQRQNSPS